MNSEWIKNELKGVADSMCAMAEQSDVLLAIADACAKALKTGRKVIAESALPKENDRLRSLR